MNRIRTNCLLALTLILLASGCVHRQGNVVGQRAPGAERKIERRFYNLEASGVWQLDHPERRFDASGLLMTPSGDLLTINDRNSDLFRIQFEGSEASVKKTGLFPPELVRTRAAVDRERFDCEGIAQDDLGRLYISEEADRSIYRWDPKKRAMERLQIDWSPVSDQFKGGINASFEGIAVGGGRIYVVNERSNPLIIVVDLDTFEVVDHFLVMASGFAFGGPHYSDLSWFAGHLYVLDRNHRAVLQVDPESRQVLAEFRFGEMEQAPEVDYQRDFPTGTMEGLAVTATDFWLVTDNNGRGRSKYPRDVRPTLFRCARPDRN